MRDICEERQRKEAAARLFQAVVFSTYHLRYGEACECLLASEFRQMQCDLIQMVPCAGLPESYALQVPSCGAPPFACWLLVRFASSAFFCVMEMPCSTDVQTDYGQIRPWSNRSKISRLILCGTPILMLLLCNTSNVFYCHILFPFFLTLHFISYCSCATLLCSTLVFLFHSHVMPPSKVNTKNQFIHCHHQSITNHLIFSRIAGGNSLFATHGYGHQHTNLTCLHISANQFDAMACSISRRT